MRIVNWNCCRGKHEAKLAPLLDLQPSLAVVQETPRPARPIAESQLWHGNNVNQGLLVLSFGGWRLEPAGDFRDEPQFFLPAHVIGPKERFNLLAVWIKPGLRYPLYLSTIRDGLRIYEGFINSAPTLLIGDLNSSQFVDELYRRFGLISAYHRFFRVVSGREKHPTYYFLWNAARPFHFDYCFFPREWRRRIKSVKVGTYARWTGARLSDHCPIIVDVSDRR
jgi:hypothetical protein